MVRGRPKLGVDEALAAAERRRVQSAERMRRMRDRRRAAVPPPEPSPPPAEIVPDTPACDRGGIAALRLRMFVERIERLEEEMRAIRPSVRTEHQAEVRDIYAEAKATGYDPSVLKEVIRIRKMDREQQAVLPLYLEALEP